MALPAPPLPKLDGWHLIGAFPDQIPDDVGSWLLHAGGEAMLLELPPGLTVEAVREGLASVGAELRFIAASHIHEDHLDPRVWNALVDAFSGEVEFWDPAQVRGDLCVELGGEPLWLLKAPKHSVADVVTVFRGVAMTGDIELGTLDSVNREVSRKRKALSMEWLGGFERRTGYRVHTIVSAHLNDVRTGVDWPALFTVA